MATKNGTLETIARPCVSDGRKIQMDINSVTEQSLESTRRMRGLCEAANEAAISTIVSLDAQGEKLDGIEKGIRNINQNMVEAKHVLGGMTSLGFSVPCSKKSSKSAVFKLQDETKKSCDERHTMPQNERGLMTNGGFIPIYTNDVEESEMDKNLQQVSNLVGNLRKMANDIGCEIDNQNPQIEKIIRMVGRFLQKMSGAEEDTHLIDKANKKTKKLLK